MRLRLVGLAVACGILTTEGLAQQAGVTAEVTKAVSCFQESLNRHDMPAFGQCFAPRAEFVNVVGTWWKGREAIEKNHAFLYGTIPQSDTSGVTTALQNYAIFKTTVLTFTSVDVQSINERVAVAHAPWRVVGDARTKEPRNGLMTLVVVNEGGRWLIAAVHNGEVARAVK